MDYDMRQSDLSRLTTMLSAVGCAFARCHGPGGWRGIEIGTVTLWFDKEGRIASHSGEPPPPKEKP